MIIISSQIGGDNGIDGYPGLSGMKGESLLLFHRKYSQLRFILKGRPGIPGERKYHKESLLEDYYRYFNRN